MKYLLTLLLLGYGFVGLTQTGYSVRIDSTDKKIRFDSVTKIIDSLRRTLKGADESELFDIYFNLFREYLTIDKDSSAFYLECALKRALKNGDSIAIVRSYNAKATTLKSNGELKEAIELYEIALGISKRNQFCQNIKYLLNNLAICYTMEALYDKALSYNFESLEIREFDGDALEISIALGNIGYVYEELGDFENALIYYEKCYLIKVENNVKYDIELALTNVAVMLNQKGKHEIAEAKLKEVFIMCKNNTCRDEVLVAAFAAMGTSLFNQNKIENAEEYFEKSLRLGLKYKMSQYGYVSLNSNVSNYYWLSKIKFKKNRFPEAIQYLDSSQELAKKAGIQKQLLRNYELYSTIFSESRDYKRALDFQILYHQLSSDIINGDVIRRISTIRTNYEIRETLEKIEFQEKIMKLQQETISQHRLLNYLIGLVAFLTLGLALILYRMNRQKQEINRMLDQRVIDRTIELKKNRDELKHAHDEQSIVLKRVSSDLNSSLASLKGLSQLAIRYLTQEHAAYFKEAVLNSEKIANYVKKHIPQD